MEPTLHHCTFFDSMVVGLIENIKVEYYSKLEILYMNVQSIEKYWAKVQQQQDGSSCGLYVVAFVVDFTNGVNIEEVRYDEIAMRNHFAK